MGIVRSHYVGRTFISPDQRSRELEVRLKLSVVDEAVAGKRIVVVDDSIVRGTRQEARSGRCAKPGQGKSTCG